MFFLKLLSAHKFLSGIHTSHHSNPRWEFPSQCSSTSWEGRLTSPEGSGETSTNLPAAVKKLKKNKMPLNPGSWACARPLTAGNHPTNTVAREHGLGIVTVCQQVVKAILEKKNREVRAPGPCTTASSPQGKDDPSPGHGS